MGKLMSNCGTQAKERARQQKQSDKEFKRMLTRQKKTYAKTSDPNANSENAEPVPTGSIIQSAD